MRCTTSKRWYICEISPAELKYEQNIGWPPPLEKARTAVLLQAWVLSALVNKREVFTRLMVVMSLGKALLRRAGESEG